MLAGQKDKGAGIFNYLRALLNKRAGFTIVEVSITCLILSIILAGVFVALNTGQFSFFLSSEKLGLQSEVRIVMDWVIKDLRQAISWNIADSGNNPSTIHLKFKLWDWNSGTGTWDLSADYIEYDYDSNAKKLTRKFYDDATGDTMALEFSNIIEAPFYTTYLGTGDPANTLDADQLRNNRKLTIVIIGQKLLRGSLSVPFNLKSEVKIRNG